MDINNDVKRQKNPRKDANIFKIITFSWMLNLFKIGRRRELEENDLYEPLNEHKSSTLGDEFEKKWKLEVTNARGANRKPSLLRVLIQIFGVKYAFCGFIQFMNEICLKMSLPLLIGELLTYFNAESSSKIDLRNAYICAFGLAASVLISMIAHHSNSIEILHCGMKMRVACCSTIYRKALRLSRTALGVTTVGQVVNLLSNDVSRFDMMLPFIHYIWIGPFQTILVTYFLWQELGASSIVGISTLILFVPLQSWFARKISQLRSKTANKTDERVRLMSEIISGIQAIKMYTWEKYFEKLVEHTRKKEIRHVSGSSCIAVLVLSFVITQTRFQMFTSVLVYVLLGHNITIRKVFVMAAFYNILLPTMAVFFNYGLKGLSEILVSIDRIQTYLLLEEKDAVAPNGRLEPADGGTDEIKRRSVGRNGDIAGNDHVLAAENSDESCFSAIAVTNVTAKWTDTQSNNAIDNIDLTVRPGRLVAIIGPVGAGKSSLMHAILRELPPSKGRVSVHGVVSYASQEPWLFGGSVRQNILFDSPMDRERYDQVVDLCALKSDFEQFPYGDRTIVGERGTNLSGGQKARINLARAVYKRADIYLLDDPLSAVDSRVGKHLFEKCIEEFLKDKTRILITHQIQHLNNADQVVLMRDGKIISDGSYKTIQTSGFDFVKLLGFSEETAIESEAKNTISTQKSDGSKSTPSSVNDNPKEESTKPNEEAETRTRGQISKSVYISYLFAGGSSFKVFVFFFMSLVTQVLTTGVDYWITFWVNQEDYVLRNTSNKMPTYNITSIIGDDLSDISMTLDFHQIGVIVYTVLTISMIVAILIRSFIYVSVCMCSSTSLHNRMLNAIIKATMQFFNTNSSGRILNRFSKDLGIVDEVMPTVLMDFLQLLLLIIGIVFLVGLVNIYLMIPTLIVAIIFNYIRIFYLHTSRSVKRLEGVTRSPVLAHVNASLQGITTIRAHRAERILSNEFDKHQDLHSAAWYLFISSNEAFGTWLDTACFVYISIIIYSFLIIGHNVYGGLVGLVITQTIRLVGVIQWGIRQSAELENQMTSVERILEYTNSPQESRFESSPDKKPPNEWPDSGKILFRNFNLKYKPGAPYILKNINIHIRPMEKIGIVGRTGAGKSSVIGALFRLALNDGNIYVDDVEIHEIGLHDLRSKISIIPQEPILFSGTMRTNLDPFDEFSDHVLWETLAEVELKSTVENLPGGLNSKMSATDCNLSVGQKQLLCLARAVLRNNKVLVLDEATANVDPQTDALIQDTIRYKFRKCTVLTIAHRLNTVMDSDRVIVMDAGRVVEFDHAFNLLNNKDGFLYRMVEQTGPSTSESLHNIAEESFKTAQKKMDPSSFKFLDDSADGVSKKKSYE